VLDTKSPKYLEMAQGHISLSDIFTKPPDEQTFNKLRHELNILDSRNFFWYLACIAHKYTFYHVSFIYAMTNVSSSEFQTKS
jgi:hypothetical protein